MEIATLAGGCFWCTEAVFSRLRGIINITPGYTGGSHDHPTYDDICTGKTGHAEAIKIEFDPAIILYTDLLDVFFSVHDPSTLNQQGPDIGTQYRSAIFYHTEFQKNIAQKYIESLRKKQIYPQITTELVPAQRFYEAEEYHKQYYETNPNQPYCQIIIAPKILKLSNFEHVLRTTEYDHEV